MLTGCSTSLEPAKEKGSIMRSYSVSMVGHTMMCVEVFRRVALRRTGLPVVMLDGSELELGVAGVCGGGELSTATSRGRCQWYWP